MWLKVAAFEAWFTRWRSTVCQLLYWCFDSIMPSFSVHNPWHTNVQSHPKRGSNGRISNQKHAHICFKISLSCSFIYKVFVNCMSIPLSVFWSSRIYFDHFDHLALFSSSFLVTYACRDQSEKRLSLAEKMVILAWKQSLLTFNLQS